jgi:hypothetical protein
MPKDLLYQNRVPLTMCHKRIQGRYSMLELDEGKLSRPVLRRGVRGNSDSLADTRQGWEKRARMPREATQSRGRLAGRLSERDRGQGMSLSCALAAEKTEGHRACPLAAPPGRPAPRNLKLLTLPSTSAPGASGLPYSPCWGGSPLCVADCIIISPACNQRIFRATFTASIAALRTGFCATETAIILVGQQWIAAGQHYLPLTRGLAGARPLTPVGLLSRPGHPSGTGQVRRFSRLKRVHASAVRHWRLQV